MTDLEITKKCAGAMGLTFQIPSTPDADRVAVGINEGFYWYMPLKNDAQAMALIHWLRERGGVTLCPTIFQFEPLLRIPSHEGSKSRWTWVGLATDEMFRRAICECVVRLMGFLTSAARNPFTFPSADPPPRAAIDRTD